MCEKYCALPWFLVLPYKTYSGDPLPCNNYRSLPWWLATVRRIPWLPITIHQLLCNTVVAVYRDKRYRDEKSLPRKALNISLSALVPETFVSRDGFGSPVPRQPALLMLNLVLTYGIPPEFRGGVHLFIYNRHTPSGQSQVYRVTQLRTDGVYCRDSVSTGPVNLKVVPNECCLCRSPWTN